MKKGLNENMKQNYTAYIEKDIESGMYIGSVPGITGAHTCAETIDDLQEKLKEVVSLCLEVMGEEEVKSIPIFAGISQIEVAI
ncbi:MAG: type II toxin-antitoxin system HicB family antitoxin [Oscillospiraceae bacterium]|nr:type II toxin-antitoxin system HicB family antitoxin [Oscillospiraceae bacterium]